MARNSWLLIAGLLSLAASALHIATIFGGPAWYRFFGAGERMARLAEQGSPRAVGITLGIAAVLAVWAAYAFSGAGLIARLPMLRTGLVAISLVYLARALVLLPALSPPLAARIGLAPSPFWIWSSLIVLAFGLAYAIGTLVAWPSLRPDRG